MSTPRYKKLKPKQKQFLRLGCAALALTLSLTLVLGLMPGMRLTALAQGGENLTYKIDIDQYTSVTDSHNKRLFRSSTTLPLSIDSSEILISSGYRGYRELYSTTLVEGTNVNVSGNTVTVNGAGTSKITIETKNYKPLTYLIIVTENINVDNLTLNKTEATLTVGGTETLTATVSPDNATDKSVTWTSSDTTVATVSDAGVVTAVAPGTATITVTTTNGGKTASCVVTVNPVTYTVTYKVENGTWSDGTTADKTETVTSGSAPSNVPTGMIASEGYKGGAWNTNPAAATITEATTFTYTFDAKTPISQTVTFKVVNGSWDDETTEDKTVTLTGYEGDTLKLAASQIPAVGSKPNNTYKSGSWDVTPSTDIAITAATTYTYTYAKKESAVVPAPDTPSSSDDETYFFVPDGTKDSDVSTAKDPSYQWRKNSGNSLLFVIKSASNDDKTFAKFTGNVWVDGDKVDSKYITAAKGSLRLTLKPEYLKTLSVGEHTLRVGFTDGSVSHTFTVLPASTGYDSPGTGENGMTIALNCLLLVISAAGAAYAVFRQKKAAA